MKKPMRIIAGAFKNRKLLTPDDRAIRPTSDRVRESLFNLLMHGGYGGREVVGQRVADLCCGTGALGLEALSRGAEACLFVDHAPEALALARKNAAHLGVEERCRFVPASLASLPPSPQPHALVFCDAPYHSAFLEAACAQLRAGGWVREGGLLVLEQADDEPVLAPEGWALQETRTYGKASLRIYRRA